MIFCGIRKTVHGGCRWWPVTLAVINKACFVVFCRRPRHAVTRVEFLRPSSVVGGQTIKRSLCVAGLAGPRASPHAEANVNILVERSKSPREVSRQGLRVAECKRAPVPFNVIAGASVLVFLTAVGSGDSCSASFPQPHCECHFGSSCFESCHPLVSLVPFSPGFLYQFKRV